jgi:hypothetical protein
MNGEPSDEHINLPDRIYLFLNFLEIIEVGIIVFRQSDFHLIHIVVNAVQLPVNILQFVLVDLQDHAIENTPSYKVAEIVTATVFILLHEVIVLLLCQAYLHKMVAGFRRIFLLSLFHFRVFLSLSFLKFGVLGAEAL